LFLDPDQRRLPRLTDLTGDRVFPGFDGLAGFRVGADFFFPFLAGADLDMCRIIASPNAEQLTFFAPFIRRAKSYVTLRA